MLEVRDPLTITPLQEHKPWFHACFAVLVSVGVGMDSVDTSERGSIDSLPLEPNPDPFGQDTEMHCSEAAVTSFIKSFIPRAQLVEHIGSDMTYVLPAEAAREGRFQDLFEELDKNLGKLHIGTYGVSDTTLEEVSAYGNVYLTSLPFVSGRHHGHATRRKSR